MSATRELVGLDDGSLWTDPKYVQALREEYEARERMTVAEAAAYVWKLKHEPGKS